MERDVRELQRAFTEGDAASRKRLIEGYHSLQRFENLDPEADELSEHDAQVLLANKRGFAHWVKYYDFLNLDIGVRDAIRATQANDPERLKVILSHEPEAANPHYRHGYEPLDPNFRNYSNDSIPLFEVSENIFRGTIPVGTNEYAMTEALIEAGADPEIDHGHPMTAAVSFNAINVARALLDHGAAVDGPYGHGCPMAFVMHFGFTDMAELLVERGARLDLRFAAGVGDLATLKSFINGDGSLKDGAGVQADPYTRSNSPDDQSRYQMPRTRENILHQAFYFACRAARFEAAEFLFDQGIDINAVVPGLDVNATTLHWCCWWGSSEGQTLDREATEVRCLAATRFLLAHGADPNSTNARNDSSPMNWAATEAIKKLL